MDGRVKLEIEGGSEIYILPADGATPVEQDVARRLEPAKFEPVLKAVEGVSRSLSEAMSRTGASEATIEFGIQVSIEGGSAIALIGKFSSEAQFKIQLKWAK